jgi:glycosyltransferase involved in cell wall biosynthesis
MSIKGVVEQQPEAGPVEGAVLSAPERAGAGASDAHPAARRVLAPNALVTPRKKVLFVQRRLPHYRVAMFESLRKSLRDAGMELTLVTGEPAPHELTKNDGGELDWAVHAKTRYLWGERLCWLPLGGRDRTSDLVIVGHENKLIYNHLAITVNRPNRIAFMGHGKNSQSRSPNGLRERFKRWTGARPDWWFAYTQLAGKAVEATGFPKDRITVFDNAIDDRALRAHLAMVDDAKLAAFRTKWNLGSGPVGLYMGSLYGDKRLPFLIDAAKRVRAQIPNFQLLIAGDGEMRNWIAAQAQENEWIHWAGAQYGLDKALCLKAADLILMPGAVGLIVSDGFVAGLPTFTTDCGIHGPEIDYVEDGVNGVITPERLEDYVAAIVAALRDRNRLAMLRQGAYASAQQYTLENMVHKLTEGIAHCLAAPGRG